MRVRHGWHLWLLASSLAFGASGFIASPAESGVLDASWIAPTTNTDGTPLTDLAAYRVYFGTSAAPCPNGTFVQIASPSPSPAPNSTVAVRLTSLTTGARYNVAVAAVDATGNQSACSVVASATPQIDFSVTPTGSVNFGNVNVGSFATQTFTVQSTRSGTVTGTASVAAPFSVVSGSPFTLIGNGATQTVTVRFTPTTAATASTSLNVSADGDVVSRLVTGVGIGTAADTIAPSLTISSPTANATLVTGSPTLTLGGSASDNVGVTQVTWANDRGGSGVATGTTTWTTGTITLQSGLNTLSVTARDAANNRTTRTLRVTLTGTAFTFTDDPVVAQITVVKAIHVFELRAAINTVRASRGLAPFAWTDAIIAPGVTAVRAVHLTELRTALNQAYQAAGRAVPTYTDPAVGSGITAIRASHLNELRAAVRAL
jgi:hypothetical protein